MDSQQIKDQLRELEAKREPWFDRQLTRLVESRWTGRIVIVAVLAVLVLVALW